MICIAPKTISPSQKAPYKNQYKKLGDKNSTIYNDK